MENKVIIPSEEFIYLMMYYHKYGKQLVLMDEEGKITYPEAKIGFTNDISRREKDLNSTKWTLGLTMVAAWKVDNMRKVEKQIHSLLDNCRIRQGSDTTEMFEDDGTLLDRLRHFMSVSGYEEIPLGDDDSEDSAANATRRERQNNKGNFTVFIDDKQEFSEVLGEKPTDIWVNSLRAIIDKGVSPEQIAEIFKNNKGEYGTKFSPEPENFHHQHKALEITPGWFTSNNPGKAAWVNSLNKISTALKINLVASLVESK